MICTVCSQRVPALEPERIDLIEIYMRWTRAAHSVAGDDPVASFEFLADDVPQLFREIAELRHQLERCEAEREAKGGAK